MVWPYNANWDHNGGSATRSATIIRVEPLPEGTTDIDVLEAGWQYVDEEKIVVYGAITETPCSECVGDPVNLQNVTFQAGTNCECAATTSITIGTKVEIEKGARVVFKAPRINVQPGFHVQTGGIVNMRQQ